MAIAGIPKSLSRSQRRNYRLWLIRGKGRPQATALAKSSKASFRAP